MHSPTNDSVLTLVFLRNGQGEVENLCMLRLRTEKQPSDAVEALKAAVTEWVASTDKGRDVWDFSCCDLNIGDLDSHDGFADETLLELLRKHGVEYVGCSQALDAAIVSYDKVLVDRVQVDEA
ncbi:hypothetical protein [Noviherbaspirillum pedocola]|uniref:Uncharacterized protein n=1 Tax=Noviherbaspirillum pedocola TaxID=2801341 RepID=A0A934SUY7_9BURK|nr:hypothetical protein [Noviherbaspirillum pedocola]MBK4736207.1 hypothetical protein [Noviherbaspirillum pedocola]